MADEIEDSSNPPLTNEQRNQMLLQLDAEIAQGDAQRKAQLESAEPAKTESKPVETAPTPETAPEGDKDDGQQKKDKDGEESLEKIQEDIKHLEKGIHGTVEEKDRLEKMSYEEKVAHFLKVRKEKRREYTQSRQELSQERKTVVEQAPLPPSYVGDLTPELKQQVIADMEKDAVETIDRMIQARLDQALDRKVRPALSEWESEKTRRAQRGEAEELARLAKDNSWVLTEGVGRLEKVLEERPWLKQSPTPWTDALRFVDDVPSSKGTTPGQAQSGPGLPILGSSGVVPPSSLDRSAADASTYEELDRQHTAALRIRDFVMAEKLEAKMAGLVGRPVY
jgi:hypothetical protein